MRPLAAASRHSLAPSFSLALLLAFTFAGGLPAPAGAAFVEPAVRAALAASPTGNLHVIVMLSPVPGDLLAVEEEVPRRQSRVLASVESSEFMPVYRYRTFAGMTGIVTALGVDQLAASPEVESIMLDGMGEGALNTSVPYIGANTTYNLGITGNGVTVAVLDSGIDTDHPDLADDVAPGAWHFLGGGTDVGPGAEDDNSHGSNVSGIITSRGIVSSRGVAPDTDILAIKVLDASNLGHLSDWAAGVDHVVANRASYSNLVAINMSLVTFSTYPDCPCDALFPALQAAINAAKNAGITTFVSSGNRGTPTAMAAPACNSAAVPVAAVYDGNLGREPDAGSYSQLFGGSFGNCFDASATPGLVTCFSCRSTCNELAAPGRRVFAPIMGGSFAEYTGTSMAAPHAAGVAALIRETRLDYGLPAYGPDPLVALMKATGSNASDPSSTQPLPRIVNALLAVNFAVPPMVSAVFPNGGESLLMGSSVTLRWNASDNIGVSTVDLQFSTTGPAGPFTSIATGVPNTGSRLWAVGGPPSTNCWLRVTARDASANAASDLSNAAFTIEDPATATTLARFDAAAEGAGIRLQWRFADASEFTSVAVERAAAGSGPWSEIATERAIVGDVEQALDRDVAPGALYYYRLAGTDRTGAVTRFAAIAATAGAGFAPLALTRISPNPSTGPIEVEFALPRAGAASLRLLDLRGGWWRRCHRKPGPRDGTGWPGAASARAVRWRPDSTSWSCARAAASAVSGWCWRAERPAAASTRSSRADRSRSRAGRASTRAATTGAC